MDTDILLIDRSGFLIFSDGDEDEDDFDEMVTRNALLVDAMGYPLTEMESYLDCLAEQRWDIDYYLSEIEDYQRRIGL